MPFEDDEERKREIGQRIKRARREAGGMSQRELGEFIGVTENTVQAYEQGRITPNRLMQRIADATGVTTAWLYHGEEATTDRDVILAEINASLKSLSRRVDQILAELRS